MATNPKVLERVRRVLAGRKRVVEKRMVGGSLGLMVDGKLCVSVGEARILVRVDPDERLKLLKQPGAKPMRMGGRTLKGFIFVESPGYRTDAQLKRWIRQSLEVIAAFTKPSESRTKRTGRAPARRKTPR